MDFFSSPCTPRLPVPQQLHWWASQGQHLSRDLTLLASSMIQTLCHLKCRRNGELLYRLCQILRVLPRKLHKPRSDRHLILWNLTALIGMNRLVIFASLLLRRLDIIILINPVNICWGLKQMGNKSVVLAFKNFSLKITTETERCVPFKLHISYPK